MKIKSLLHVKLMTLFLFSCTIDANLNEDYKNKVKGMLNSVKDNQETANVDTSSNDKQNLPIADKVAAELQKQSKAAANKGLQNQPQAAQNPQIQALNFKADLSNLPNKNNQTSATRVALAPKQISTIQAVTNAPKSTNTFNTKSNGLPTFNLNYNFSQPNSSVVQTQTSSGRISKLQTLKNELIRTISEERNKTQNNFGLRETYDQFKMKDSAFDLLDVISNAQVYDRSYAPQLNSNTQEAENERNKFYAIMDFDQHKIEQFGSIMETLYKENQNHGLIKSLIISGLGIQISFELALEEIDKKIEIFNQNYLNTKINSFDFTNKLKDLKSKLNQILDERKEWSSQVDALIADANANSNLRDSNFLAEYIQNRYLDNMQNARQSVLDTYIRITELK
ncbi:hypothetical protein Bmayo_04530 (plasmid) [Borreliella mayonii]|uniref:Outer surface protein n=1 Tax=Borreliella mayonii TaxID=1674146 RepID=A0AAC9KZH9_9SPIR|nr:complement regulator-acquiring protein [Borreliella mayonii]APS99357.1 hypothetical protein A7X70_06235 [Borreliella mayonii]APT00491.1 hypothetical protein Bmayo_04530 [Borreliella mayonii]